MMRYLTAALAALTLVLSPTVQAETPPGKVDFDFVRMNPTIGAAQFTHLLTRPQGFLRKRIRMRGRFITHTDANGKRRFACQMSDTGGCCVIGTLAFVPKGNPKWPDDYPVANETFTVQGTLILTEGPSPDLVLADAEITLDIH